MDNYDYNQYNEPCIAEKTIDDDEKSGRELRRYRRKQERVRHKRK